MRQWRVGSFSMALVLIMLGIALLISQFNNKPAWEIIGNWWPAALIMLGIEILLSAYFSKTENPRIKYDFFAVAMVLIVGAVSLGFYMLTSSGVIKEISRVATSASFETDIPEKILPIPLDIQKVIFRGGGKSVSLYTGKNNDGAILFGKTWVTAQNIDEARQVAGTAILTSNRIGDNLLLDITGPQSSSNRIFGFHHVEQSLYTLVLPPDKQLEVERRQDYTRLELYIDKLESKWLINNKGPVLVNLARNAGVKVTASAGGELSGNVEWELGEKPGIKPDQEEEDLRGQGNSIGTGSVVVGVGKALLEIHSDSDVVVNLMD